MNKDKYISSLWNFDTIEAFEYLTHGIYRWYGKLVPQLVSKILDLYSLKNDNIIANFSGSGTIALEALKRNINCVCTDINPLALLISKVKTTHLNIKNIEDYTKSIIKNAKVNEANADVSYLYQPSKWYREQNAKHLVTLKNAIDKIEDSDIKNFYYVVLASIVRDCSNIDSRCVNHIVVDKNKKTKEVYESFLESALSAYDSIQNINNINSDSIIKFINHTASDMSYAKDNSIDLVFSHPPYLNAINYYNIYRLSTDILGMNYEKIRNDDFSAKKIDVFLKFIHDSFKESYRVLKNSKRCVVVIGDTRYKGNLITLHVEFINLLKSCGFSIEDIFIWEMNKKAGMNVARRGNYIDHNYIIVAKKETI